MRLRPLALIGFVILATPILSGPLPAADTKPATPAVVVRVNSIDSLITDALFVAEAAGQGNKAKQVEGILKQFMDPKKGLGGIDTTKRIGIYGKLAPKLLEDGEVVVMLPIVDESALLNMLDGFGVKAEKGKDDVYKIDIPNVPVPGFFRFANGYLYATVRDAKALGKDKLLAPAAVLPAGKSPMVEVLVDMEAVPADLKDMAIGQASLRLGQAKGEKKPGESDAEYKFRIALLDELANQLKSVVKDGKQVTLSVDVDHKIAEAVVNARFTAKPGTKLAASLADAGKGKSLIVNLSGPDSALSLSTFASVPAGLRKPYEAFLDAMMKQALDSHPAEKRELLEQALKAITPTLKAMEFGAGLDLRGPSDKGHYTFVTGVAVKEGGEIEKTVRTIHAAVPEEVRTFLKLDVEKVGTVNIHRLTIPPEALDAEGKRILGDNPIYIAIRYNAVLVAGGEKGLDALKDALGREPKDARLLHTHLSVARLAGLDKDQTAAKIAGEVFGKNKADDKVHVSLKGGEALELHLSAKLKLIEFFMRVDEQKKKGAQ